MPAFTEQQIRDFGEFSSYLKTPLDVASTATGSRMPVLRNELIQLVKDYERGNYSGLTTENVSRIIGGIINEATDRVDIDYRQMLTQPLEAFAHNLGISQEVEAEAKKGIPPQPLSGTRYYNNEHWKHGHNISKIGVDDQGRLLIVLGGSAGEIYAPYAANIIARNTSLSTPPAVEGNVVKIEHADARNVLDFMRVRQDHEEDILHKGKHYKNEFRLQIDDMCYQNTYNDVSAPRQPMRVQSEAEKSSQSEQTGAGGIGAILARLGVTQKPHSQETPTVSSYTPAPTTTFSNSYLSPIWEIRVEQNGSLSITANTANSAKELAEHLRTTSPSFRVIEEDSTRVTPDNFLQIENNTVRVHNSRSSDVLKQLSGEDAGKFRINQKCASGALNAYNDTQAPPDRPR